MVEQLQPQDLLQQGHEAAAEETMQFSLFLWQFLEL